MSIFKKKEEQKQFSLTEEERAEMAFFTRGFKEKEFEMRMWATQVELVKRDILTRNGIKTPDWGADWSKVFETGRVTVIKMPPAQTNNEERKPDTKN